MMKFWWTIYCRWCFLENYIVTWWFQIEQISRLLFSESQVSDIASPQAKELLGWLVHRNNLRIKITIFRFRTRTNISCPRKCHHNLGFSCRVFLVLYIIMFNMFLYSFHVCWERLFLSHPKVQDMLLFVMFLFQNLPHYVPKTTIIFSTMLGVSW